MFLAKVRRWAIYLSPFDFKIEHIRGRKSVFYDMLTRWTRENRLPEAQAEKGAALHLRSWAFCRQIVKMMDLKKIEDIQQMYPASERVEMGVEGIERIAGKVWIPDKERNFKVKVYAQTRCGIGGHCWCKATECQVRTLFTDRPKIWRCRICAVVLTLHCFMNRRRDTTLNLVTWTAP